MRLGLKVDVDTYEGMRDGVPKLLQLFKELEIKASFFIPFGPDESGKAIFRIFKKRGFLKKMFRTNALSLYSPRTFLHGTLLPAPKIGSSFPEIVLNILKAGHELGIHGYNHVYWQDHLLELSPDQVRAEFDRGITAYEKVVGEKPKSFAAPAWTVSLTSLQMIDELKFDYASDTRGPTPFIPHMQGKNFKTLQIPSTLPTADELLGQDGMNALQMHRRLSEIMQSSGRADHVHTLHTEVEGNPLFQDFRAWLQDLINNQTVFFRLCDWAKSLHHEKVPACEVTLSELPGRAGPVACQKI